MLKQLISLGLLVFSSPTSYACKPELPSQRQAFNRASSVFIGEVVDITDSSFQLIKGERYFVKVRFKVLQYWKGRGALDRKSTRLNSSHVSESRMPSSA